jgi:Flp pilus assembly protein TadG
MLRARHGHWVRLRRGNALALTGVCMVLIVGVLALIFDGGLLMSERRHAQAVCDAAALAAAYSIYDNYSTNNGLDPTGTAAQLARTTAASNGYTDADGTSTVTVNIPPLSGSFKGKTGYAEVNVQHSQSRSFSAIWGSDLVSVAARSVARGIGSPSSPAILLLAPTMQGALYSWGNGQVTVTGGLIVVDSSSSQAATLGGGGTVITGNINIYGGYSNGGSSQFVGKIQTNVSPTADPLSTLPAPDPSSLVLRSSSNYSVKGTGTFTLQPGLYKGGIAIQASSGLVTFSPGIYCLQGGGLSVKGKIAVTGSGVAFYNDAATSSDQVVINSSGNVTLSPPTSGAYKGVTIFQARAATAAIAITANGTLSVSGTIYAAGAEIDLSGNGAAQVASQIIANNLNVTGGGSLTVTYSPSVAPIRDTRIVE